jgi:hypothetical protein
MNNNNFDETGDGSELLGTAVGIGVGMAVLLTGAVVGGAIYGILNSPSEQPTSSWDDYVDHQISLGREV